MNGKLDRPVTHEHLRRADRHLSTRALAGSIAHEFNNVLSAISGYSQLARAEIEPHSRADEHLAEIVRACDRGAEMTARLEAFSRSGSSQSTRTSRRPREG